uniref:Uncharacterized protein n=1 Tax=Strigamia maritima TaxID=126957 RepID=T1JCU4_STRMM
MTISPRIDVIPTIFVVWPMLSEHSSFHFLIWQKLNKFIYILFNYI